MATYDEFVQVMSNSFGDNCPPVLDWYEGVDDARQQITCFPLAVRYRFQLLRNEDPAAPSSAQQFLTKQNSTIN